MFCVPKDRSHRSHRSHRSILGSEGTSSLRWPADATRSQPGVGERDLRGARVRIVATAQATAAAAAAAPGRVPLAASAAAVAVTAAEPRASAAAAAAASAVAFAPPRPPPGQPSPPSPPSPPPAPPPLSLLTSFSHSFANYFVANAVESSTPGGTGGGGATSLDRRVICARNTVAIDVSMLWIRCSPHRLVAALCFPPTCPLAVPPCLYPCRSALKRRTTATRRPSRSPIPAAGCCSA